MTPKLNGDHCRCTVCGEHFNSTYAFDKHRRGEWHERYCWTKVQMLAAGMALSNSGWWISSAKADSTVRQRQNSGDRLDPLPNTGVAT